MLGSLQFCGFSFNADYISFLFFNTLCNRLFFRKNYLAGLCATCFLLYVFVGFFSGIWRPYYIWVWVDREDNAKILCWAGPMLKLLRTNQKWKNCTWRKKELARKPGLNVWLTLMQTYSCWATLNEKDSWRNRRGADVKDMKMKYVIELLWPYLVFVVSFNFYSYYCNCWWMQPWLAVLSLTHARD